MMQETEMFRWILSAILILMAFACGIVVRHFRIWPYRHIIACARIVRSVNARISPRRYRSPHGERFTGQALSGPPSRFDRYGRDLEEDAASVSDSIIWLGGYGHFAEYAQKHGCLAVEFSGKGDLIHAIPLRLDEIKECDPMGVRPYSGPRNYPFQYALHFFGIARHSNGDIFTTVHHYNTPIHPTGGGIMKVDRDGHTVWYRRDYSHHAPSLGRHPEYGEVLVCAGLELRRGRLPYSFRGLPAPWLDDGREALLDLINVIDPESGELLNEFSVADAIENSIYSTILDATPNPLDPTHVNSVFVLDEESADSIGHGIVPGDLIVSMRTLSAFGFFDARNGSLKRLVRGNFLFQHSARYWRDRQTLLFDNQGSDGTHGPSRLIMIDAMTGAEHTVFPNADTPPNLQARTFSRIKGHVSISPDRSRAICTFPDAHMAVEVGLPGGELFTVFDNLHNLSSFGEFGANVQTNMVSIPLNAIEYVQCQRTEGKGG